MFKTKLSTYNTIKYISNSLFLINLYIITILRVFYGKLKTSNKLQKYENVVQFLRVFSRESSFAFFKLFFKRQA